MYYSFHRLFTHFPGLRMLPESPGALYCTTLHMLLKCLWSSTLDLCILKLQRSSINHGGVSLHPSKRMNVCVRFRNTSVEI